MISHRAVWVISTREIREIWAQSPAWVRSWGILKAKHAFRLVLLMRLNLSVILRLCKSTSNPSKTSRIFCKSCPIGKVTAKISRSLTTSTWFRTRLGEVSFQASRLKWCLSCMLKTVNPTLLKACSDSMTLSTCTTHIELGLPTTMQAPIKTKKINDVEVTTLMTWVSNRRTLTTLCKERLSMMWCRSEKRTNWKPPCLIKWTTCLKVAV